MTQWHPKHKNLWHWFDEITHQYSDRIAYQHLNHNLTYQQLKHKSLQFASYLCSLGIKPNDRVAIMLPNCMQQPIGSFACLAMGAIIVNVNPLYTPYELKEQLNDAGVTCIIVLANMAHIIDTIRPEVTTLKQVIVSYLGDELPYLKSLIIHWLLKYWHRSIPSFSSDHHHWQEYRHCQPLNTLTDHDLHDTTILQYTGGTTGLAKGVMLSHYNLLANLTQIPSHLPPMLYQQGNNVVLTALPLYHIFSLMVSWVTLQQGGQNLLVTNPRDIKGLIKLFKTKTIHAIPILQTLMDKLLKHPSFSGIKWHHLVATITGGMATRHATAQQWHRTTGCIVQQGYGLSETSPVITLSQHQYAFDTHVGTAIPMTQLRIINQQGQACQAGDIGEILVKGPQITSGYWGKPDENRSLFHQGWLKTGDLGCLNECNQLIIKDRLKDMIVVSGFNVYPSEVEQVIQHYQGITEVCIVGQRIKHTEQVVAYYTSQKPIPEYKLRSFCEQHITHYKIPTRWHRIKEIPKSTIGKVLKKSLKSAK